MKKVYLLIGLLLGLATSYYVLNLGGERSSRNQSEIAFAVPDTQEVQRIRMQYFRQGEGRQTLNFKRSASGWQLNDQYTALQAHMNTLLATLQGLHVREVLIEGGRETGLQLLEQQHILVEVSGKYRKILAFQVGREGKDARGSLMKKVGAENPYIVEIPGFQGYLNSRFSMDVDFWRENLLFNAKLSEIEKISLTEASSSSQWSLYRKDAKQPWQHEGIKLFVQDQVLESYLSLFKGKIYAESFAKKRYPDAWQQLEGRDPDMVFSIHYFKQPTRTLYLYRRADNDNNYFGWIEGEKELLTVQKFVIDKFLIGIPLTN